MTCSASTTGTIAMKIGIRKCNAGFRATELTTIKSGMTLKPDTNHAGI